MFHNRPTIFSIADTHLAELQCHAGLCGQAFIDCARPVSLTTNKLFIRTVIAKLMLQRSGFDRSLH